MPGGPALSVPTISNPIVDVTLGSGIYKGSLSSSQTLGGSPVFYFQTGVITQWYIYFVSSNSTTNFDFLTENWPVYTEDSLFTPYPVGTSGVGEIGRVGGWTRQ